MIPKEILYRQAVEKWGILSQLDVAVEECAELIKEIQKLKRCKTDREKAMVEMLMAYEVVDVEIMCEQIRCIFKDLPFDKLKKQKLERLQIRLGE